MVCNTVRIRTVFLGKRKTIKVNDTNSISEVIRKINTDIIGGLNISDAEIISGYSFSVSLKQFITDANDLQKELKNVINSKRFELKITKNICGGTSSFPNNVKVERKKCVVYDDYHTCTKLECGCWISYEGVRNFVTNSVNNGKPLICKGCSKLMDDIQTILDLCGFDDDTEDDYYEILAKKQRIYNKKDGTLKDYGDAECPHCEVINRRTTLLEYKMTCANCSKSFCYECEETWKSNNKVVCGNKDCTTMEIQDDLENCGPLIINKNHGGWVKQFNDKYSGGDPKKMIPLFRACIGCWNISTVVDACRHITCDNCQTQYCYVCLKSMTGHSDSDCDKKPPHPTQKLI